MHQTEDPRYGHFMFLICLTSVDTAPRAAPRALDRTLKQAGDGVRVERKTNARPRSGGQRCLTSRAAPRALDHERKTNARRLAPPRAALIFIGN